MYRCKHKGKLLGLGQNCLLALFLVIGNQIKEIYHSKDSFDQNVWSCFLFFLQISLQKAFSKKFKSFDCLLADCIGRH